MSKHVFLFFLKSFLIFGASFTFAQPTSFSSLSTDVGSFSSVSITVPKGNPSEMTEYRGTSLDTLKKYCTVSYEKGRVVSEKNFNPDGTEKSAIAYTYSESGKVMRITGTDSSGNEKWSYSYSYNQDGNLSEEISFDADKNIEWKAVYEYTEKKEVSEKRTISKDDKITLIEQFAYTVSGKIAEYTAKYSDNKLLKRVEYSYGEGDRLEKELCYDGNGLYEEVTFVYEGDNITQIKRSGANETTKDTECYMYLGSKCVRSCSMSAEGEISLEKKFLYDWQENLVFEQNGQDIVFREYSYASESDKGNK